MSHHTSIKPVIISTSPCPPLTVAGVTVSVMKWTYDYKNVQNQKVCKTASYGNSAILCFCMLTLCYRLTRDRYFTWESVIINFTKTVIYKLNELSVMIASHTKIKKKYYLVLMYNINTLDRHFIIKL